MTLVWESSIINAIMLALKTWRNYNNGTPISKCWLHNFSNFKKKYAKNASNEIKKPLPFFATWHFHCIKIHTNESEKKRTCRLHPHQHKSMFVCLIWSLWLSSLCNMTFGFHRHLSAIVMITHRDIWCIQTESNHSHSGCCINLMHQIYVHQIHSTPYLLPLMEEPTTTFMANKAYMCVTNERIQNSKKH